MKNTLLILLITLSFQTINVVGQNLDWNKVTTVLGGQVSSFSIAEDKIMVASPYTSFFYSNNFGESYELVDKVGFDDEPEVFLVNDFEKSIIVKDGKSFFFNYSNSELEEITFEDQPVNIIHVDKESGMMYKMDTKYPYTVSKSNINDIDWISIFSGALRGYTIDKNNIAFFNYSNELHLSNDGGLNFSVYDYDGKYIDGRKAWLSNFKFHDNTLYVEYSGLFYEIIGDEVTRVTQKEHDGIIDFIFSDNKLHITFTDSIITYDLPHFNLINNQKIHKYQSIDVLDESVYMMDTFYMYEYKDDLDNWVIIKDTRFEAQRTESITLIDDLTLVSTYDGSIFYKKKSENKFNLLSSLEEKFLGKGILYSYSNNNQLTLISNSHLIKIDVSSIDSLNTESIEVKKAFENDIREAIYFEGHYYLLGYEEGHLIRIFNSDFETISSFNVDVGNKAHFTKLEGELVLLANDRVYSVSTNNIQAKSFLNTPSIIEFGDYFYSFLPYPNHNKVYKSSDLSQWTEVYDFGSNYDIYDFKYLNEKYLLIAHWRGVSYLDLEDVTLTDLTTEGLENVESDNMGFSSFDYSKGKIFVQYERGGATYELDYSFEIAVTPFNLKIKSDTLTWSPLTNGGLEYSIEVNQIEGGANSKIIYTTNSNYFIFPEEFNRGKYEVKIKAKSNVDESDYSQTVEYVVSKQLEQPVLYSPNDSSKVSVPAEFNWGEENNVQYHLQISHNLYFETFTIDSIINSNQISLSDFELDSVYFWRVKYLDYGTNSFSDWSEVWSFTTQVEPVGIITLSSPQNTSTGLTTTPTLLWNQDSNSDSYTLQLSTDEFSTFVVNESLTDTTITTPELEYNVQYSWRVRGSNSSGDGEWSEVWSFTTVDVPLVSPSLSTPFNEQVNVGTLTEFTWNEVESSVSYQLQIFTDNQFSSTVFDSSKIGSSSFTLTEPLTENTTYFWRMKSISDNELRNSEWSDTLIFTTGVRTSIEDELIPQEYTLFQNYPNPFNPSTQIQYALPEATEVTLEVFNSLGQKVMELVNGHQSAGYHTATFDASGLSSGVYLYKLTTPPFSQTNKMLLIK